MGERLREGRERDRESGIGDPPAAAACPRSILTVMQLRPLRPLLGLPIVCFYGRACDRFSRTKDPNGNSLGCM